MNPIIETLQSAGIVVVALMAIGAFIDVASKRANRFGEWTKRRTQAASDAWLGGAMDRSLNKRNGGTAFGDLIEGMTNDIAVIKADQIGTRKEVVSLHSRLDGLEAGQNTLIELLGPTDPEAA